MKTFQNHLTMSVYRDASGSDCTLGGLSSKVSQVEIVAELDERESFLPAVREALQHPSFKREGAVILITRKSTVHGSYLAPLESVIAGKWCMFGGNLAFTSNGVVTDVTGSRMLQIHDRHES